MRWLKNILKFRKKATKKVELKVVEVKEIKKDIKKEKVMPKLDLSAIKKVEFPREQYYAAAHPKKQIYLHHTVSGEGVSGDINWWKNTSVRVATCVIIGHDGVIHQCFSSKFWAHHLGIKGAVFAKQGMQNFNTKLNQQSIGIEIDNWGGLEKKADGWYTFTGKKLSDDKVQEYPDGFRGFKAFEKYTDAQIEATRQLLEYWGEHYDIDLKYKGDRIFDICKDALEGDNGVYTHCSVRPDKSDVHPQPNLIEMLKSF